MRVAILANGRTIEKFANNSTRPKYDKIWGLNQQATWQGIRLDRCYVMDDLKLRMPYYSGFDFTEFLKSYERPIITSKAYPEWPTSEAFPIKEVVEYFGMPLGISMYSTPDYMIAHAIFEGATQIDLYGVDQIDKGTLEMRLGTAAWIGAAFARGVLITTQPGSVYQYLTSPGVCFEAGMYGYARRPRIEDLVAKDYYEAWKQHREQYP